MRFSHLFSFLGGIMACVFIAVILVSGSAFLAMGFGLATLLNLVIAKEQARHERRDR